MVTSEKKCQFKLLNIYSWSLLLAFICATFAMQYNTSNTSLQGFFETLPLIIFAVYFCEKLSPLVKKPSCSLGKVELFKRNVFLLSFSFLLGSLISLIFSYNNSDAKGWWSLIISIITFYGLFFSIFFSALALLIENHKTYIMAFSLIVVILVSIEPFFPHRMFIPLLGNIDTLYVTTCSLLIFHCLFVITQKIIGFLQAKRNNVSK